MRIKKKSTLRWVVHLKYDFDMNNTKMFFCFKRDIFKKLPWNITKECDWTHSIFSRKGTSVVQSIPSQHSHRKNASWFSFKKWTSYKKSTHSKKKITNIFNTCLNYKSTSLDQINRHKWNLPKQIFLDLVSFIWRKSDKRVFFTGFSMLT